MPQQTGFIGLGAMGGPMSLNVAKDGIPLVVHDIDATKTEPLAAAGAEVADSPARVAEKVDRTVCLVETTDQAMAVICDESTGIIASAKPGHIVVCMSTINPAVARKIGDILAERDIHILDAPISGGTGKAMSGELSVIVGGDSDVFEKCRDIFDAVGSQAFHIGPLGQGLVMKLINNMLGITTTVLLAEGLALGVKSGIGLETMRDVLMASSGASETVKMRMPRIIAGDFEPGGTMDIVFKDQELVTAFAKEMGVPMLMANVSEQVYQMALTAGLNKLDSSAVVKIYEQLADVQIVGKK